jgi:hypothetical protein
MLWDAEKAPENFGFSHNVEAVVRLENGAQIVDKIVRVRSVDLVADPATTSGLFESERATPTIAQVNADVVSAPNDATFAARLQTLESERDAATQRFEIARFLLEKLATEEDPAVRLALGAPSFLEIALESRDAVSAQRLIDGQLTLVREAIKLADARRVATSSEAKFEPIVSKSRAELNDAASLENFAAAIKR